MSLIYNLLNQNNNDLLFSENINISDIFNNYKNYEKYINKNEKILIENIDNINNQTYFEVILNNINYDYISNIYLYIEFNINKTDNDIDISDIIDTIELYIGDNSIEKITIENLQIYFNIYKNTKYYNFLNLISKINYNNNKLYLPIIFYFMLENKNLLPLYLLYNEEIKIFIKFKSKNLEIINNNIYLIVNYIKIKNEIINNIENKEYIIEKVELNKTKDLVCTIDGKENTNKIIIKTDSLISHILFKINNNKINEQINNKTYKGIEITNIEFIGEINKLRYNSKELEYLSILNTNFNLNYIDNLYLLNFALFKEKLSGIVNFENITSIILEINTINIEDRKLTIQNINNGTSLQIIRPYGTSEEKSIKLTNNIEYIIENKTEIDIFIKKENEEIYEGWNENNNILKLDDNIQNLILSSSDKNIQEIKIENTLTNKTLGDFKNIIGQLNLYIFEYKIYNIKNGQLQEFDKIEQIKKYLKDLLIILNNNSYINNEKKIIDISLDENIIKNNDKNRKYKNMDIYKETLKIEYKKYDINLNENIDILNYKYLINFIYKKLNNLININNKEEFIINKKNIIKLIEKLLNYLNINNNDIKYYLETIDILLLNLNKSNILKNKKNIKKVVKNIKTLIKYIKEDENESQIKIDLNKIDLPNISNKLNNIINPELQISKDFQDPKIIIKNIINDFKMIYLKEK